MKRLLMSLLAVALVASGGFAQVNEADRPDVGTLPIGDARAYGLGGAMTAVNDDMNTLFYNPAGLSFLRRNYFNIEAGLGTSAYAQSQVSVASSNAGSSTTSTGTATETTVPNVYYTPVIAQPKIVLGGKCWGLALTADYLSYMDNGVEYTDGELMAGGVDLPVYVSRRIGAVAGLGFNLGPVAVGANMKYYNYSSYDFTVSPSNLDTTEMLTRFFVGNGFDLSSWEMNVGIGAIVTFGSLNVGAYYDNMMPFINALAGGKDYSFDAYLLDCFETMSVGLSWMPSNDKFAKDKFPIDLLATIDLKNLGSNTDRELCAGVEAGLDLWNFLVATARLGYKQDLATSTFTMEQLLAAFAPGNGELSAGVTAKFAMAKADLTLMMPMGAVTSTIDGESMDWTEVKVRATVSLCL